VFFELFVSFVVKVFDVLYCCSLDWADRDFDEEEI
jgi:hypothetical protein